jgi:hypothetical protein
LIPTSGARSLAFGCFVLLLSQSVGCSLGEQDPPATEGVGGGEFGTVVFIVLDTVRSDHLSLCGYERPTSPNLDRLARSPGASWTCRAHAPGSWTLPSHASYFTGLEVPEHKAAILPKGIVIGGNKAVPLEKKWPTLATRMSAKGYETLSLSSNPVIDDISGLVVGFDQWKAAKNFGELSNDAFAVALREMIAQRVEPEAPLFVFLNIADAHAPFSKIPAGLDWIPRRGRFMDPHFPGTMGNRFVRGDLSAAEMARTTARYTDGYDYGIFRADRVMEDSLGVLREMGYLEGDFRIVLTSDHGEFLTDRGLVGHDTYLFEPNSRVPLVYVRGNGNPLELPEPINATSVYTLVLDDALPEPRLSVRAVGYPNVTKQFTFGRKDLYRELSVALWRGHEKWLWMDGETQHFNLLEDADEVAPTPVDPGDLPRELKDLADRALSAKRDDEDESEALSDKLRALGYIE